MSISSKMKLSIFRLNSCSVKLIGFNAYRFFSFQICDLSRVCFLFNFTFSFSKTFQKNSECREKSDYIHRFLSNVELVKSFLRIKNFKSSKNFCKNFSKIVQFAYFTMTVENAEVAIFSSDPPVTPRRNNDTNLNEKTCVLAQ